MLARYTSYSVLKMAKYLLLLLFCFCLTTQNLNGQSYASTSLFGLLGPFGEASDFCNLQQVNAYFTSGTWSNLRQAIFAQSRIQSNHFNFIVCQERWDHLFYRSTFQLNGKVRASKSLLLIPSMELQTWNIEGRRIKQQVSTGAYINYQLNEQWRLALQIACWPKQTEKAGIDWKAGIYYHPTNAIEIEFNTGRNPYSSSLSSSLLLHWIAHKNFRTCLGKQGQGAWLWMNTLLLPKTKVYSLIQFHPQLGLRYLIGIQLPLFLRRTF